MRYPWPGRCPAVPACARARRRRRLVAMSWIVELVIIAAAMPVAAYALIGVWRAGQLIAESRRRPAPPAPLARLEADLRRLRAELEDTETRAGLIAKNHRVQAVRGAY